MRLILLLLFFCAMEGIVQFREKFIHSNRKNQRKTYIPPPENFDEPYAQGTQGTQFSENLAEYKGQVGEYMIERILRNHFAGSKIYILNNIYVPYKNTTSEIDILMIHEEKGIFVFESKNYSGWIFGTAEQLYWTQSLPNGEKYQFYNPVRQNANHIQALSAYLGLPMDYFYSLVVFSDRCSLKKVPVNTSFAAVVQRSGVITRLSYTLSTAPVKYHKDTAKAIADRLLPLTRVNQGVREEHINRIRETCPFCGGQLKRRGGRNGIFWGCNNYPRCRFTRPIER